MLNWSTIGTVILGSGGLITGVLALLSSKSNKNKIDSETDINIANVEQVRENLSQSRERFLSEEITALKQEVGWLRLLIENHVPWDWEVVRQLKLAGIEMTNPPTLNYIKNKYSKEES